MVFSKARNEHKCSKCRGKIQKGDLYINQAGYRFGSTKTCLICVLREIQNFGSLLSEAEVKK